ncbi:MAG TPA: bifunctional diguanylate cyclase/phosphodiesterase [Gemmatimonadaceae bacterium]|nr:bifunctional diguanylate cyclase/phosphodiesterase [Gemmatimonadaceae bacterium]
MRLETASVRRSSRALSVVVGVIGISLATTLYLSQTLSGLLALVMGSYALACAALALVLGDSSAQASDVSNPASGDLDRPSSEAPDADETRRSGQPSASTADPAADLTAATPELRDPLTGLASHMLLRDRVDHALARAHRHERPVAIMVLDIDGFRSMNDAFGYAAGDRVLAAVAARLASTLRGGDTAARIGTDEFALLLEDMADESNFVQISERVSEALSRPITVDTHDFTVTACTGIAQATPDDDANTLLRNADAALVAAKRRGRGACEVFSDRIRASLVDCVGLESDLRAAVEANAFDIEYQPIVILHSRRIAGVEALIRWRHPSRGDIPPSKFLPVADDLGLSPALGRWVLLEACRQVKGWQDQVARARALTLTVNISRAQLRQPSLIADVANALALTGIDPRRLVLEVSDAVLLDDAGTALSRLQSLKSLGVRIAIDDFGARQAALHQLPRIPVDILKIDKAFIDRVGRTGAGVSVAHVVLALGKSMRLRTVAEGVEAEEQVTELLRLKCEFGQGMLFSRPLSAAGVGALLRSDRH